MSSEDDKSIAARVDLGMRKLLRYRSPTKFQHLAKVEQRVLDGSKETGKINDLLQGCQHLFMDPRRYALHLGANGFLKALFGRTNVGNGA